MAKRAKKKKSNLIWWLLGAGAVYYLFFRKESSGELTFDIPPAPAPIPISVTSEGSESTINGQNTRQGTNFTTTTTVLPGS